MNFLTTFVLTTLPAGVCIWLYLLNKKETDTILLKYNAGNTPKVTLFDFVKVFRIYKSGFSLEKREKRLLVLTIVCIVVGYITIISWAILILFFPAYVFGD
jgi:hypothetical protein